MRTLSKSKFLYCLYQRQARLCLKSIREQDYADNINAVSCLLHNAFCTVTLQANISETVYESPEFPNQVKYPGKNTGSKKSEDEDFVPPSLSDWIVNHKIHDRAADMNSIGDYAIESDIDKISKILKNWYKSPDEVVKALDGCDVDVPESLVERVLQRFSCEWIPSFGFFKWAEWRKGTTFSPYLYNLMVEILGRAKKFDTMWQLMEEMKKLKGYITLDTMAKAMQCLARAGEYEDAIEAFRRMELFGVNKDITAMNILINALVKGGNVWYAERVYVEFKDRIPPNTQTCNILVYGWCKCRQIGKAMKTVDEMKKHGICPDIVTYTSFIVAYCHKRDFPKVGATLEEMKTNGCHPSSVTYTAIMTALSKAKETDKALEIYEQMKKDGCSPDVDFYSVLIHVLSQAGRLEDSEAIFEDMSKQGVVPGVGTYNTLIRMAATNSQEVKALNLLRRMEENQCKPDLKTYTPLLKMCCRLKRIKVLSFLLEHMFNNDVSIDPGTYSLLVNRLSRNERLDCACSFFEEMVRKGFVPLEATHELLIGKLEKMGMHEEKRRVEKLMLRAKESRFGFKRS